MAAAFDEAVARAAGARLCESSGSEHTPAADLSDLVNSFLEKEYEIVEYGEEDEKEMDRDDTDFSESKTKDKLEDLLGLKKNVSDGGYEDEEVKRRIIDAVELACRTIGDGKASPDVKRRLMSSLRDAGFDAGLCKTRWEKTGRHPGGTFDYIDVIINNARYIVEINLAAELEIARPTSSYISLLNVFDPIFVGKAEQLKQIVRLICHAARRSMKKIDLHIPPWRRNCYMQLKWFATYKRTTNEVPGNSKSNKVFSVKRSVGFEAAPVKSFYCRDNFAVKMGTKVGHLTTALKGL